MLFSSIPFLYYFLPVVLLVYFVMPKQGKNAVLLVFSLLCTYIYRRTGNVYTGAFTVAAMAAWIITGGSAML